MRPKALSFLHGGVTQSFQCCCLAASALTAQRQPQGSLGERADLRRTRMWSVLKNDLRDFVSTVTSDTKEVINTVMRAGVRKTAQARSTVPDAQFRHHPNLCVPSCVSCIWIRRVRTTRTKKAPSGRRALRGRFHLRYSLCKGIQRHTLRSARYSPCSRGIA